MNEKIEQMLKTVAIAGIAVILFSNIAMAENSFQYPLDTPWTPSRGFNAWVNNWDGAGSSGYHLGQDIPAEPLTTRVKAASSGIVKFVSTNIGGFGSVVVIEHPESGVTTLYGHLSRSKGIQVKFGDDVTKESIIGYIGSDNENGVGGPHLHFGIHKGLYSEESVCGKWL